MREVKTRAAVEQPKMREKSAMPRAAVRILQRRYAQEKRERKPEEYATEQVQQGAAWCWFCCWLCHCWLRW